MATRISPPQNKTYYINPAYLTFVENSGYGANLIQVSASSSCYISVYDPASGIGYSDADRNYKRWKVTAYNNKFPDDTPEQRGKWFIYVRLERNGVSALVVYDQRERGVSGGVMTDGVDDSGKPVKVEGEPDPDYFYVMIGEVGETDGSSIRQITYDTGYLTSNEAQNDKDGINEMWELVKDGFQSLIRAKHWLQSFSVKGFITILGGLVFNSGKGGDKRITDIKRSVDDDVDVPISDENLATSKFTEEYVEEQLEELDERFLLKIWDDRTPFKLNVGDQFTSETYARLQGITEADDVTVNEAVHSKEFVSGFTSGKGWAIRLKEYLNSAGVTEQRAVGELDDLIVRGTLKVFEFVISQMLGENDNRTFTGMMEVDHYDRESGMVYFNTRDGQLYNPFRKDDIIIVQQYSGMPFEGNDFNVIKQYELVISEAGIGDMSLGENRLDWVRFRNFASPMEGTAEELIVKGDTFVRIDNLTDARRKGIMQIMTVGEDTPYMDVVYGRKTDPDNALKTRIGNLEGVYNHLFGWLKDFGAYIANLYAVGEFRIAHTGEDISDKIEMTKGAFRTNFNQTYYDITSVDNHLKNGSFSGDLEGWVLGETDTDFLVVNGIALYANRNLMTANSKFAGRAVYNDKDMMRVRNSDIRQINSDVKPFGTHKEYVPMDGSETEPSFEAREVKDTAHLFMRFHCNGAGTLEVGFDTDDLSDGAFPFTTMEVEKRIDAYALEASGIWNGEGDFVIRCTGDIYIEYVSLTDKPVDNLKITTRTWIEQDAGRIALLGEKINNAQGTMTNLGIELNAVEERLNLYVTKTDTHESQISQLQIDTNGIRTTVASVQGTLSDTTATANSALSKAQDALWEAQDAAYDASVAKSNAATALTQSSNAINLLAVNFDDDGNVKEGSAISVYTSGIKLTAANVNINGIVRVSGSNSVKIGGWTVEENKLYAETGLSLVSTIDDYSISIEPSGMKVSYGDDFITAEFGANYASISDWGGLSALNVVNHKSVGAVGYTKMCALRVKGDPNDMGIIVEGAGCCFLPSAGAVVSIHGLAVNARNSSSGDIHTNDDFIKMNSDIMFPSPYTLKGKILFVKCSSSYTLTVPNCVLDNESSSGTKTFDDNHMRAFISNGTNWFEMNLTDTW